MPTVRLEGVTAIAALLIASFAVDRIVAGVLFILSFFSAWTKRFPEPTLEPDEASRFKADRKQKLARFVISALIALPVLAFYGQVRILAAVGFEAVNPLLDQILTGCILIGGADRIGEVLKWGSAEGRTAMEKRASQPLEITGKLTLESADKQTSTVARSTHA